MPETATISAYIRYPPRYDGLPPPDWARKAFIEDEVPARVALGGKKRLSVAEMQRETRPDGDIGAWWAAEVVLKRRSPT